MFRLDFIVCVYECGVVRPVHLVERSLCLIRALCSLNWPTCHR